MMEIVSWMLFGAVLASPFLFSLGAWCERREVKTFRAMVEELRRRVRRG